MGALSRFTPFFIAAAFPLFAFAWFVPKGVIEIDLWLLWLVAMVVVGLPMLFAEFALAKRSQSAPFAGIQVLTRQSDVGVMWRSFAGLSIVLAILLAARLIAVLGEAVATLNLNIHASAVSGALMIGALIVSLLKSRLLPFGVILALIGVVLTLIGTPNFTVQMTQTSFGEWGVAVVMALISVGVGTGLYWFAAQDYQNSHLTRPVLFVWLAQLLFGFLGFAMVSAQASLPALLSYGVGGFVLASFLLHYASSQLTARFGVTKAIIITIVLALALALVPASVLMYLLVVVGLLAGLVLAIFSGWMMKISHLRKSFNFGSELRYNLWRVAMRIAVPLAIITGLLGFLLSRVS